MRDSRGRRIIALEDVIVVRDVPAWVIYHEWDGRGAVEFCDPTDRFYRAFVRFDGCITLNCMSNGSDWGSETAEEDSDGMHICEIDDMIGRLQSLREEAIKYFGSDWPVGKFGVVMLPEEQHGPALQALKDRK